MIQSRSAVLDILRSRTGSSSLVAGRFVKNLSVAMCCVHDRVGGGVV